MERLDEKRRVIATHKKEGWRLELLCESSAAEAKSGGKKRKKGVKRSEQLRIPPSEDHVDIMISGSFPGEHSAVRLPLWTIDLKFDHAPEFAWGQAHTHAFHALQFNRSVLPLFNRAVRTSILDYGCGVVTLATWEISSTLLQPLEVWLCGKQKQKKKHCHFQSLFTMLASGA